MTQDRLEVCLVGGDFLEEDAV
ncbi:hypothetical protein OOU_Y34scaffold00834g2 [Pyricularia oryzae Y34]|uniref:Uncharacterized protein n=2 Tax=Pyricularia oryzae TaxID=318829 RepID=A0AA97PGP8_PYRO3|nr:hypothetical protein OOU_Y34scaffold00834g2 [Pyricularia oryzae Y34]